MSRINIEDSLFKDPRYTELVIAMGSRHAALGAFVEACILAQEFYLNEGTNRMIPIAEWKRRKAVGLLIDVGLAEYKGNNNEYIYIIGSSKQFSWLLQKSEAGQKSSEKKLDALKKARLARWNKDDLSKNGSERALNGSEALTLSPTLSPTLSQNSNSNSNNLIITSEPEKTPTQAAKAVDVVVFKISSTKSVSIKKDLIESWSDTYPKEYLDLSIKELRNWVLSNEHKAPKSQWSKFINSWFQRGWERYRTTLKSQPTKLTADDLNDILGASL